MTLMIPVQVCQKCTWVGVYDDTVRVIKECEEATIACPRCKEYTVTVPLSFRIKDVQEIVEKGR